MRTTAIVFPFDQFGNSGTAAGAELLADALREVVDDTADEIQPVRASAYAAKLNIKEHRFDTMQALASWKETGRRAARQALAAADFLIWLGGNHLGALPLLETLEPDTLVVQFDAHLDIYNLRDCKPELCHGNFLLHAERLPRIVNVGCRDLFLTAKHVGKTFEAVFASDRIAADFDGVRRELQVLVAGAPRVWIDLDADAFDPAFLPAVCEPMPFGLSPPQVLALVQTIGFEKLAGLSISEFAPGGDVRDASLNLLGWLLEWVLDRKAGA
jgi:agmatinase